jgi:cytochrome c oxidase assembly protein subunit 15
MQVIYKRLVLLSVALTFAVVVLGAYVRLNDAGLGCPDWPGCYGQIGVPQAAQEIAQAQQQFPGAQLEPRKGWIEMVHRYCASILGLMIVAIALIAWRRRADLKQSPALALILVAVVVLQGMLGMWTVTLLLRPAIVTAHLLGGMTTLALLSWLALGQFVSGSSKDIMLRSRLHRVAGIALIVLTVQIALGGWVSTNYAAIACSDFPTCRGRGIPSAMDFFNGFHLSRELGETGQGELLSIQALTAIHWTHRIGALVTTLVLGALAFRLLTLPAGRKIGTLLLGVLSIQIWLGIANAVSFAPLSLAVLHNAFAALLLTTLVATNYLLHH